MERLKVGVCLHIQTFLRWKPMLNRLAKQLEGHVPFPLVFFDNRQRVYSVASIRMFRER
jgi:hypothetical protein